MIVPPHPQDVLTKNDLSAPALKSWIISVTDLLNKLEIREGNGSPNGVLKAEKKTLYYNKTGALGTYLYMNLDGVTAWAAIG